MGLKQTILAPIILVIYMFVAIFVGFKRLFEYVGQKLTDIAFN